MHDISEDQNPSDLQRSWSQIRSNSLPHVQELEEQVLWGRRKTRGGWSPVGRA